MRTTGVIFNVDENLFDRNARVSVRYFLSEIISHIFGISPADIEITTSRIAIQRIGRRQTLSRAIAVYDTTVGGLRLTEPIYTRFSELLAALKAARSPFAEPLQTWYANLSLGRGGLLAGERPIGADGDWIEVYAPGSHVLYRDPNGLLHEVTVRRPCIIDLPEYAIRTARAVYRALRR